MAEAEMFKLQNELQMKTEAQGVEIKMILERLRTDQAAAITNISYELKREVCALNAVLDASVVKRKSDLQGMEARLEALYCGLKYYCVGAVSTGGLAIGLMVSSL
ncbi:hypothetical protein QVD17_41285 [Tagetes erecta]|uniref:Uncharacterized protein n=1 Tax=Tagetes erecta TaxID=13708 RepID=A0AAD8JQR8_TARER|nr:hypothetical protein QVD17_41285 [Tagetes erecta]